MSFSSLDYGSQLQGPSPKVIEQLNSTTLIFTHPPTGLTVFGKHSLATVAKARFFPGIEVKVGLTFQDGDRFNSGQVIYSRFEKLTVWCALWAGGIIGPYFFKNDEGHNVTVNGDRYRAMITNFFIPELNNHDVQELWFQQDGATCHTARATIDLLKDTFGDCLISRFGPVNWPPRSCDLTPLDYFLWGYVKSLVYADKPQTLDHLEDNIRRVIADIRPQMLEKVIENWTSRLDYIRASRGSPMPEIIFKM
ncbi:uncharacterized protein TNCV_1124311 [Trichonephila clavipes]|uniref:Transposase n=1 Tax=Trichonephila clavipes TaxID=2585209 RepID=A0A8X6VFN9_TRICX|nr:uncharacterized protein TNCV_1124311 [Trichonephila clavipes]